MKLNVALFFAGLFGALATFFILLSFGTDYWLLATETCPNNNMPNNTKVGRIIIFLNINANMFVTYIK